MIKLLKSVTTLLLALCLMLICLFQSFGISIDKNDDILSKTDCFDYLLSHGYPEEFLETVTESTLKNMVSLISNNEISDVIYETKQLPENSNIIIETVCAKMIDMHTGSIVGESVCVHWKWSYRTPIIREEDFISVSWNKEFFVYDADSFYAEDYYKDNLADSWSVSNSYTKLAHSGLNSLGHWTKLKTNKNVVGGSMMFNLLPNFPVDTDNYNNNLRVEYTHQYELLKVIIIVLAILLVVILVITLKIRIKRKNILSNNVF